MSDAAIWKAVLTGDIISSSRLKTVNRVELFNAFASLSSLLKINYPNNVVYDISNFRGDSWQLVCEKPETSLAIALFIRSFFQYRFKADKLDTRLAIGIGTVNFIPPKNVSAGDGEAFTLSGHLLDSLVNEQMAAALPSNSVSPAIQFALDGMLASLDFVIEGWSPSQSQAVHLALHQYKQDEIAQHWTPRAITQASVSVALKAAGWVHVKNSISAFESLVKSVAPAA